MPKNKTGGNDAFAKVRSARTAALNYDMDTDDIVARLARWQASCAFTVAAADADSVDLRLDTLPPDMDAFVRELYEFCPDLVDQGTGCVGELINTSRLDELPPDMRELVEGVDFDDDDYGLEILKRQLTRDRRVTLWWD